jgi:cysteine desulfurase
VPAYLDYNATAPVRREAAEAVARALASVGNPSSVHAFGRTARRIVEDAREAVAALIGARPSEIVFTSSGTEANALAIEGAGRARVLASMIEHESVLAAARSVAPAATRLPVGGDGVIDLDAFVRHLGQQGRDALVSVMLANNETGVIQPVAAVAQRAHAVGALVHCDAVQQAGKGPIDVRALGVDLLTLSAHKLGGPQGVGALFVADRIALSARLKGGGQERGRRAGTENVPGIAGFAAAAVAAHAGLADAPRIAALRDRLEAEALRLHPSARIFGASSPRLPNTSCIGLPGLPSETQVMVLDLEGIAVSAGAACSSGKVRVSHVLTAMGATADEAASAIRVSLGWDSSADDIDRFLAAWGGMARRLRRAA